MRLVFVIFAAACALAFLPKAMAEPKYNLIWPQVSGRNLSRQEITLPGDLKSERTLLLVAFKQKQQTEVDTWLPLARQFLQPNVFDFYELPTLPRWPGPAKLWLENGMRSGIPDPAQRQRTLTLHIDKDAFKSALNIDSEAHIQVFLVDRAGNVVWRAEGPLSVAAERALRQILTPQT
ncbi:MAG TPA: hypothetical protein DCZ49_02065 [Hyphomonadaceae bacterium]|nr:hypothetical protein [Hyphomonadaceae bacterium]